MEEDNINMTNDGKFPKIGKYIYVKSEKEIDMLNENEEEFFKIKTGNPTISDSFKKELISLLKRYSRENQSNTPDHILSDYLLNCLTAFDNAVNSRTIWYDFKENVKEDK